MVGRLAKPKAHEQSMADIKKFHKVEMTYQQPSPNRSQDGKNSHIPTTNVQAMCLTVYRFCVYRFCVFRLCVYRLCVYRLCVYKAMCL